MRAPPQQAQERAALLEPWQIAGEARYDDGPRGKDDPGVVADAIEPAALMRDWHVGR